MKLRQLAYLHEVVQQSFNISAAANALFTSQSGISRQLQELADELGIEIFQRHGKRLIGLTKAGEEITAVALEVIRDTERIRRIADAHRRGQLGEVVIVATRHAVASQLHETIVRCRNELPALQVRINQEEPAIAFAMLREGSADLGLLTEPTEQFQDLAYYPLTEWRMLLVTPKSHPICNLPLVTLEAITGYPCCSFERSALSRQVIDQTFASARLKSPITFSLNSSANILQYVETGVCLGLVGEVSFIPAYHPNLRAIDVSHLFRTLTSGLVLSRKAPPSDSVRAFIHILEPNLNLDQQDDGLSKVQAFLHPATSLHPTMTE
jgi:DNA-binding transcriptional LysR family regulator